MKTVLRKEAGSGVKDTRRFQLFGRLRNYGATLFIVKSEHQQRFIESRTNAYANRY